MKNLNANSSIIALHQRQADGRTLCNNKARFINDTWTYQIGNRLFLLFRVRKTVDRAERQI
jgi:hypothetical protein